MDLTRGLSLALALAVHVGLLAGLLHWPRHAPQPSANAPLTVVMVELADAPAALPAPSPVRPPVPAEREQTPPTASSGFTPLSDAGTPAPADAPGPVADADDPAPHRPDTAQSTVPAPADAAADVHPAASRSNAGNDRQAILTWQSVLLSHLQKYRHYPRQAQRLRRQGVSHVRFSVDRAGRVGTPQIERSSGHRLLDEETLATVLRANPVPPPPPDLEGNPIEVVVPVSFFLRRQ